MGLSGNPKGEIDKWGLQAQCIHQFISRFIFMAFCMFRQMHPFLLPSGYFWLLHTLGTLEQTPTFCPDELPFLTLLGWKMKTAHFESPGSFVKNCTSPAIQMRFQFFSAECCVQRLLFGSQYTDQIKHLQIASEVLCLIRPKGPYFQHSVTYSGWSVASKKPTSRTWGQFPSPCGLFLGSGTPMQTALKHGGSAYSHCD